MRLPRFTIAGLMGLVVVVAVGVAALRFASELWAGVLLMLTLAVLGAAVLAFHERTGARRAWCRGFALFGWGYLALAMGPWASDTIAPRLPTTRGLDTFYARMHPGDGIGDHAVRIWELASGDFTVAVSTDAAPPSSVAFRPDGRGLGNASRSIPTRDSFHRVGLCLWALLVAGVGGVVGRASHPSGERPPG
jgi:hypothetical protein